MKNIEKLSIVGLNLIYAIYAIIHHAYLSIIIIFLDFIFIKIYFLLNRFVFFFIIIVDIIYSDCTFKTFR